MNTDSDQFTTLRAPARASLTVRGSKFLSRAIPVEGKRGCEEAVDRARKEYFDATHHCYAWRLAPDGAQFRANDDGEPSGTAGKPILASIDGAGLLGVIVVVTRYFGGTKLGTAGLARAYSQAAERALAGGERLTRYVCGTLSVAFAHGSIGPVMRAVAATGGRVVSSEYAGEVSMEIEIRRSRMEHLRSALIEGTRGAVRFTQR